MVRCTAALQTRRTITAVYLVWRCRSFAFWQLVSKKRWPRGWHFERPCATTRCGPDLRCPNAPPSDSVAPTTCWLPGGRHFSGQRSYGIIWALRLHPARAERTHGSCWQVSRPGSLAARWEYRFNPLVDLEKVRAFATHHACALPSHCLISLRGPIVLDRSHPVGAVERRSVRCRRVRRRLRPSGGGGGHLSSGPAGVPRP